MRDWFPAIDGPNVVGRFEYQEMLDLVKSREEDREVMRKEIVLREKRKAGGDETVRRLKPGNQAAFKKRFPEAWAAFEGEHVQITGTPLGALDINADREKVFNLQGIYSVEDIANASDAVVANCGFGAMRLRTMAQELLAEAAKPAKRQRGRPKKVVAE